MSTTTTNKKSSKRTQYELKVLEFCVSKGPFKLVTVTTGLTQVCDCCGYHPLVQNFVVRSLTNGADYIIGSECQFWVLGVAEAKIPAARLRELAEADLLALWLNWGKGEPLPPTKEEVAKAIITARRRFANAQGWISRRVQGKAPAKVVQTTAVV